jgi:hypothetical protein
MTHLFFDDSHHRRGGFLLGAYTLFESDPAGRIATALTDAGFQPGMDEYKSRHPHASDERWKTLRQSLYRIAAEATIGIVVAPFEDRARFGLHALCGLAHILRENDITKPILAFFDEGLFRSAAAFARWRTECGLPDEVGLSPECDSRTVLGIQVADLVAHTCSVVLLGRLGIADKTLHSEEEGEYQLSFEMWARLRYNFFRRPVTDPGLREAAKGGLVDSAGGLYIAPGTGVEVAEVADARFGKTWLGCIH